MQMLDSKRSGGDGGTYSGGGSTSRPAANDVDASEAEMEDEIPF
jgi:hypothetical protein